MADLSPMMKQYFQIKEQNPDTLLFFRLGDFYELFFDDAKLVSAELELTLTGRDCGQAERAPMCGVPYHSAESYIARLVAKGYKVAILRTNGVAGSGQRACKTRHCTCDYSGYCYGKQYVGRSKKQLYLHCLCRKK